MSKFTFLCGCVSHEGAFTEDIQGCPVLYAYTLEGKNAQLKKELEVMRLAAYEGGTMLLDLLPEGYLNDEKE